MSELKNLSAVLEGGAIPTGYDEKAIGKLSKTYLKLEGRKVVNIYPIRTVMHEDSRYCLYACPIKGTEIDDATLQSIKAEVEMLEIGEIRYDSVQSSGYDYYIIDPDTGRHIVEKEEDRDSVMEISDHYDGIILFTKMVLSPRKAYQLDCNHALVGVEKQPNQFKIEAISNKIIGQAPTILEFEAPQESPAVEKYKSAMTVLSIIITVALLIWYFTNLYLNMSTFNYSSKSSIKDNLTEILIGAALIIVPIVYPFGIKIGTARILAPLPTAIILALVGLYLVFKAWRKIRQAGKLSAKSGVITVDGNNVTYPAINKGKVEMRSFTLSEISNVDYNYDNGILTVSLANGSIIRFDLDFFDGLPQLKEFVALLKK